ERWNAMHAYANQPVQIMEAEQILQQGIALGVDTQGCLLLQTQAGIRTIVAGDVSLRQAGSHV
ncbi:biotin--[acetyl-CoA-carboxylase] ligase, partial [Undibacterium sp. LFS511W]|nr:biotin--[acetyl-CoA-carboxylase] ligase [Undibacterium luofuense]